MMSEMWKRLIAKKVSHTQKKVSQNVLTQNSIGCKMGVIANITGAKSNEDYKSRTRQNRG